MNCPNCGASAENTYYVSPESDCFERRGDVDCLICNHSWNDDSTEEMDYWNRVTEQETEEFLKENRYVA